MDGARKLQRVAAYAVVTDSTGRVLLVRLTERTGRPGWWTLPGGGIDHGEHPADAMIREVHEETGLSVSRHELAGVDSLHRAPGWRGQPDDFHAIRIIYLAAVEDDHAPLVHEADGSTDVARWATRDDLAGMNLVDLAHAGLALLG